jgi:hypothetical protein
VIVDPAHVIAIPKDHNESKMRCSQYQIIGENTDLTERRAAYVSANEVGLSYIDDAEWDDEEDDEWELDEDDVWPTSEEEDEEEEEEYLEPVEERDLSGDYWF